MKYPKGLTKKEKRYLREVYEDTLIRNLKKGEKRAKAIAKIKFNEETFKLFKKKENIKNITEEWNRRNKRHFTYIKENVDYKVYKVDGDKLIVSTDEKLLEKFEDKKRKGLLRDMDDEFEREIFFKVQEKYDINFSPDMYFVIV